MLVSGEDLLKRFRPKPLVFQVEKVRLVEREGRGEWGIQPCGMAWKDEGKKAAVACPGHPAWATDRSCALQSQEEGKGVSPA